MTQSSTVSGTMYSQESTRMLTPDEVATYLSVSKNKVYSLFRQQGFPAFRVGKHWRTDPVLLQEWVRQQR